MSTRDPELLRLLAQEIERHLRVVQEEAAKEEGPSLDVLRRTVHALKGSSGLAGEVDLAGAMQRLERRLREGEPTSVTEIAQTLEGALARLRAGEPAVASRWPEPPIDLVVRPLDPHVRVQYAAELSDRLARIDEVLASNGDPVDRATVLYRHVHTIKGAASAVGDEAMAWFCHGLEEGIRNVGKDRDAAPGVFEIVAKYRDALGALLEDPETAMASLRARPSVRMQASGRPVSSHGDDDQDATIRVTARYVDRLLDHVSSLAVARERVAARGVGASSQARTLRRVRAELAEALRLIGPPRPWGAPAAAIRRVERAAQVLLEIGDELDRVADHMTESDQALKDNTAAAKKLLSAMRQTPIRGMFSRLAASALAEARRTGRLVTIRTRGAEEPIDRRVAEQLFEPCLQLTRNSIAHGIEPPDLREANGKPREATITLSAEREGSRLLVTIADDGAGVDVSQLRVRAVEAGLIAPVLAEAADDQTLLELLFLPGFSTRGNSPDMLAGRGVGLDIALSAARELGGVVHLATRIGQGFEARIDIPIESGLATVVWVTAAGTEHAIIAHHAHRVRVNDGADADRIPHLGACLEPYVIGRAPFVIDLDLGASRAERLSVGVDAVGTTEEVLVRKLSPLLRGLGPFVGAIVRGDGSVRLAIDVHSLAPRVRALGRVPEGRVSEAPSRPPPSRPPPSP